MIGDDLAAALPGLRAQAESRMTETVEVGAFKDDVNLETYEPTVILVESHYVGKAQIKYPSLAVSDRVAASQQAALVSTVLKVPVGSGAGIRPGDRVRVTASTSDGSLVGRWYRIAAWPQPGQVTAHRYPLEEAS